MSVEINTELPEINEAGLIKSGFSTQLQGEQIEPYRIGQRIDQLLNPEAIGEIDPRWRFIGITPIFSTREFREASTNNFASQLEEGGFWRELIKEVTAKENLDFTDVVFLTHVREALWNIKNAGVTCNWAEEYRERNQPILAAAIEFSNIFSLPEDSSARHYETVLSAMDEIYDDLRLEPELQFGARRVLARRIFENFVATDDQRTPQSRYPIYIDRGKEQPDGITTGEELITWGRVLAQVLRSVGSEEREFMVEAISEKAIRDVSAELEICRASSPDKISSFLVEQTQFFLIATGMTEEERYAIYHRIPDFFKDM